MSYLLPFRVGIFEIKIIFLLRLGMKLVRGHMFVHSDLSPSDKSTHTVASEVFNFYTRKSQEPNFEIDDDS